MVPEAEMKKWRKEEATQWRSLDTECVCGFYVLNIEDGIFSGISALLIPYI
jgi:hypothetical protein